MKACSVSDRYLSVSDTIWERAHNQVVKSLVIAISCGAQVWGSASRAAAFSCRKVPALLPTMNARHTSL